MYDYMGMCVRAYVCVYMCVSLLLFVVGFLHIRMIHNTRTNLCLSQVTLRIHRGIRKSDVRKKERRNHCNTLQHTATHCDAPQQSATHCITLHHTATPCYVGCRGSRSGEHTATHRNAL